MLLFTGSIVAVNAQEINSPNCLSDLSTPDKTAEFINENSSWGKTITNGDFSVDGKKISLLVTYEERDESLNKFKGKHGKELEVIQKNMNLSEINEKNYVQYYNYIKENGEEIFSSEDQVEVLSFFDIYENNEYNDELLLLKEQLGNEYKVNKADLLYEIDSISPDYNERLISLEQENSQEGLMKAPTGTRLSQMPNVSAASTYAIRYANNPNPAYNYYTQGGDCANFASQIARAGGMITVANWRPYNGPWINAHMFGAKWGKKNQTRYWSSFVGHLNKGDFIAADFGGDGHLDHIGYIANNGPSSYTKYIAQHTSNYYKLSSHTGWVNDGSTRILWKIGNP